MGVLDVWHPDIEEFITAKLKEVRLSKFNISANCSNEFMNKIVQIDKLNKEGKDIPEELDEWSLIFPDTQYKQYKELWDGDIYKWKSSGFPVKIYKTMSAQKLWDSIMHSTYSRNDHVVLFLDSANETHCWNYGLNSHISAPNPCGEQPLPNGSICTLGTINLTQFINPSNDDFDYQKLETYVKYAVRFLDNVNELSNAPIKDYEESMRFRRRIGLGDNVLGILFVCVAY